MSTDRHPSVRRRSRDALRARDALAAALTRAGIQLPAMDVRTVGSDAQDAPPSGGTGADARATDSADGGPLRPHPYALVHLGVCSAPVAFDLAAVIERGVIAREAER